MVGQTISHFRIVGKLGAGGMGEVYQALDTRLNRPVAIKLLLDVFSNDPQWLARFEREAKILARLSHPNIASPLSTAAANQGIVSGPWGSLPGALKRLVDSLQEGEDLVSRFPAGRRSSQICRLVGAFLQIPDDGLVDRR